MTTARPRRPGMVLLFTLGLFLFPLASASPTTRTLSEASSGQADPPPAPPPESVFNKLIHDPYERRYGHPPGDGWIPIPGTATELRVGGFVQLNVIHDFQDTGFAYPN